MGYVFKWFLLILLLVGLSVAYRSALQYGGRPRNPDESQYLAEVAYQAKSQISWAEVLESGANRPPHLFVFAILQRLFGNYCWSAVDIAHSIFVGITASLLAIASCQLRALGWLSRFLLASIFIIHSGLFNEGMTANSEHLANLFCVAFLCCWLAGNSRQSSLIRCSSFLLLGLAVSVKKQLIPMVFCAPAFWYLSEVIEHRAKAFLTEMTGCAACFLFPHVMFSLVFAQRVGGADNASLAYFITSTHEPFGFIATFAAQLLGDPLTLPAALVAGAVIIRILLGALLGPQAIASWPLKVTSTFFLFSLMSVLPGLRLWDHYFMLVAPAALLVMVAAIQIVLDTKAIGKMEIIIACVLWGCLFVPKVIMTYDVTDDVEMIQTARWISDHSEADDQVFVWGWQPELYVESMRVPATRFATTNYIVNDIQTKSKLPPFDAERLGLLLSDLEESRPALFVIAKKNFSTLDKERYNLINVPLLKDYLSKHYEREPRLSTERFDVFEKKTEAI